MLLIWQRAKCRNQECQEPRQKAATGLLFKDSIFFWSNTAEHFEHCRINTTTKFWLKWQILQAAVTQTLKVALLCIALFLLFGVLCFCACFFFFFDWSDWILFVCSFFKFSKTCFKWQNYTLQQQRWKMLKKRLPCSALKEQSTWVRGFFLHKDIFGTPPAEVFSQPPKENQPAPND